MRKFLKLKCVCVCVYKHEESQYRIVNIRHFEKKKSILTHFANGLASSEKGISFQ